MRLAFFSETFLPKVDGIVNTLCHLLDYLGENGHESVLFTPHSGRPEQDLSRYAATDIVRYPGLPAPYYPELRLALPDWRLNRRLQQFQPDLVHAVNPLTLGMAGIWQARRLGLPAAASFHTDVAGFASHWGLAALSRPIWAGLRLTHHWADLNFCPSEVTARQLRQHHFKRVKVWSHGVDGQRFHPDKRTAAWRERLSNGEPEKPLLLFVGRVSWEKRVDWLRPLLTALPNVRLAVVGDGPARRPLAEMLTDLPAVFTGYLRGEELAQAYAAADLFVFPSPHETFGNVVLEAMASGLPVVAPRSGGLLDFTRHGEHGLLFAPDSLEAFIAAAQLLAADAPLARRFGANGRRQAELLSWERVSEKLLADYQTLLRERGRRPTGYSNSRNVRLDSARTAPP
jgi:glycosyltransferase involved in cell wall biosynthesis